MSSETVDPEFKEAVRSYIDMHDQLTEANKQLRDIRKKKKELAEVIVQYMKRNEIDGINVKDGKLVRKEVKRMEPLKKEHILAELARSVGETQAQDMLVNMYSQRSINSSDSLRRTKKRSSE